MTQMGGSCDPFQTRKQNTGYGLRATWSIYVYFIYASNYACTLQPGADKPRFPRDRRGGGERLQTAASTTERREQTGSGTNYGKRRRRPDSVERPDHVKCHDHVERPDRVERFNHVERPVRVTA